MRYGIFGDVHANLAALEAVLGALETHGVDRYVFLGDLVGYGADPKACLDIVRALDPFVVGGNHDWGVGGRLGLAWFNQAARAAIEWTQTVLPVQDQMWLASLPLVRRFDAFTIAHSTLHEPQLFDYLFTAYDAYLSFRHLTTPLAFVGHSHVPVTFFDGNPIRYTTATEVTLDERRVIANVGSVGQPRDENPDAAFGVYDEAEARIVVHRVPYDIEASASKILDAGLPPILAERLRVGR